jgi:hypothetical protein
MALTITKVTGADTTFGNKRIKTRDITFDSSYPTGGEALTAADVGLTKIDNVLSVGTATNSAGTLAHNVRYDFTNSKLQAFETGAAVDGPHKEATSTADLSAYSARLTFIGH